MSYDHSRKAGNQGDLVKHVSLHAAVRVLAEQKRRAFRFADVYAGYAFTVLQPKGAWRRGIGLVHDMRRRGNFRTTNRDFRRWVEWYAPTRPTLEHSQYPSSGMVARDAVRDLGRKFDFRGWDLERACCDSLEACWGAARVRRAAATPDDSAVKQADLVFLDPPSLDHWSNVRGFLQSCSQRKQPVLAWLPITVGVAGPTGAKKAGVSTRSRKALDAASEMGCLVATSLWAKGGRLMGCALVHDLCTPSAAMALSRAVTATNRALGWRKVA